MNVRDWRILGARISRDHHMASLLRLNQLLRDVALHDLMREVTPHRVTTSRVNLKALLQRQTAAFKTNVHQATEVLNHSVAHVILISNARPTHQGAAVMEHEPHSRKRHNTGETCPFDAPPHGLQISFTPKRFAR